jgi:hypothetical protein
MKHSRVSKFLLAPAACAAVLVLPSTALAGSISGTVTSDEPGNPPIQGVEVCANPAPEAFAMTCAQTGANGTYLLPGLGNASYYVRFSNQTNNLNFVSEFYDDKKEYPGDLVVIGAVQDQVGIDAELEVGSVIKGVATDADTLGPAVGVGVCASSSTPVYYYDCDVTKVDGSYEITGLTAGEYTVHFAGENAVNYLSQYYEDEEGVSGQSRIALAAKETVTGIDAKLHPGAQIFGRVTELGSELPQGEIEVCLWDTVHAPEPEFREPCTQTDASGNYAFRSLRPSTYKVLFSYDYPLAPSDLFFQQWWNGVPTAAQATPISIAPPETRTGIDAHLIHYPVDPPRKPEGVAVSLVPAPRPAPPRHCRKGFHKKWVKGKRRCVKAHKKRHRHSGHRGPHAVATGH